MSSVIIEKFCQVLNRIDSVDSSFD